MWKKSRPDNATKKFLYLIQDESLTTKEFLFDVCKSIIQERKKKYLIKKEKKHSFIFLIRPAWQILSKSSATG